MPLEGAEFPAAAALLDEAPCGLLLTDADGTICSVNRTFCLWVGRGREALIGVRRVQDLLTVGGKIFHQTHWAPLLQLQGSIAEVKLDVLHEDGRAIPMVMNAVRRNHGERVLHELALFVAKDRHAYERELMLARKRAEELLILQTEARDALVLTEGRLRIAMTELGAQRAAAEDRASFAEQMIGIFSHDLRNPLSTIKLGAEAMEKSAPLANHVPILRSIHRATARAQGLINDLLDFTMARIGRGLSVIPKPVDLHALVAAHVEELESAYPGRALVHRRHGAGACDADSNRLFQLIGNLVSNAMHYGNSDSTVTVTSRIDDDNFAIEVHNMGQPIPAELLTRLFEPMVRGTDAESANRSVGLGLYIVSEIARAHSGDVRVASSASEGTTFIVTMARRVKIVPSANGSSI